MLRIVVISLFAALAPVLCRAELDSGRADDFATAVNCSALYEQHRAIDFSLSLREFDQTEGSGFRVLAVARCYKEAADLIEEYIRATGATHSSLRWHIAQMRALQGDYKSAIAAAESTLKREEDFSKNPLRWNDYVLATIAFLRHERQPLALHRNKIAEGKDYPGNALNLKLVDSLIRNFDKDYEFATSHIEP